jgi:hypothetical protein
MTIKEARFYPMRFRLRIITNSPAIIAAAETSFGRFGQARAEPTAEFTFRMFEQNRPGPVSQPARPSFRSSGSLIYQIQSPHAVLVADKGRGVATGYFSTGVLANQAAFRWHYLELAFFVMLERHGVMGVHGAALVNDGQAILLRAQSGGGKTTLAYAGARGQYQALAEDVVWIDLEHHCWWGLPWSFHLLPDARQRFPELADYEPVLQTNDELKLEVDLEKIRPGSTTVSARPGPVILVQRATREKSRLEALDWETARGLWMSASTGGELNFPNYQQHVDRLLHNNAYRLYFGDDIATGVDLLAPLFVGELTSNIRR